MLTRREFLIFLAAAGMRLPGFAEDPPTFIGRATFARLMRESKAWAKVGIGELTARVGLSLADTPYVGGTLELDGPEVCSANLEGLDCVTLYETSLCFARMLKHGGSNPDDLLREITFTRYRGGKLNGYLSRLHYTSDWIADNVAKGVVRDLTPSLPGAVRMNKPFDFMSTHPSLYRQLKADSSLIGPIAEFEGKITARQPYYVPNDAVAGIEPLLMSGDIVGIATKAAGLDCSHTGLIYVENGIPRFLNASSVHKKVVLGERLSDYAKKYTKNLGVMIARPL